MAYGKFPDFEKKPRIENKPKSNYQPLNQTPNTGSKRPKIENRPRVPFQSRKETAVKENMAEKKIFAEEAKPKVAVVPLNQKVQAPLPEEKKSLFSFLSEFSFFSKKNREGEKMSDTFNSFKNKEPKPEFFRPNAETRHAEAKHAEARHAEDKDIEININPWKIGKIFLVIAIIGVFFLAGRYSTISSCEADTVSGFFSALPFGGASESSPSGTVVLQDTAVDDAADQEVIAPAQEPAASDTTTGAASSELVSEETQPAVPEETAEEAVVEEPKEEPVITDYKSVALAVDKVMFKLMDTNWGKITGIKYTIKNSEAGTIKPDHFIMVVEGYDDANKEFAVAEKTEVIKAGAITTAETAVTGGFAYNEATAGKLDKVRITFVLYDASDKKIAQYLKEFDLGSN